MSNPTQTSQTSLRWLAAKSDIWIYNPNIISLPISVHEDEILALCLKNFIHPAMEESDPDWKINVEQPLLNYRKYICGQFIRGFIDKQYQEWRMPPHWAKSIKELINSHGLLMGKIWRTIRLLPELTNPRPIVLHKINLEGGLIFFDCIAEVEEQEITATKFIRRQQGINRELQALRNPFDQCRTPETWAFVDKCRRIAEKNPDFQKDYTKLIEARMKLVTAIRKNPSKVFDKSGKSKENRGRKSISSSRTSPG
jgi:hypothetical protein